MTSFGSGEKSVIYGLDIIFSITHVVQLRVSKINLFCQRGIFIHIQGEILEERHHFHTMSRS